VSAPRVLEHGIDKACIVILGGNPSQLGIVDT